MHAADPDLIPSLTEDSPRAMPGVIPDHGASLGVARKLNKLNAKVSNF